MSVLRDVWRSPSGRAGMVLLVFLVGVVVLSLVWEPHDPVRPDPRARNLGMSWSHPFGTSGDGYDLFSGVLAGSRVSLIVGVTTALIAGVIGTTLGVVSAISPRLVGEAIAHLIDVLIALPTIVLALVLLGLFGGSLFTVAMALGLGSGILLARVLRAETSRVLSQDYILAAKASSTSTWRTVRRHVLPNIAPVAIVQISLVAGLGIIAESSLAVLGVSSLNRPSWGRMLRGLRTQLLNDWTPVIYPGAALLIAVLTFNLLGDGLRDALDPRLHRGGVVDPVTAAAAATNPVEELP
jgi:peptide/nickel transport system permease protein